MSKKEVCSLDIVLKCIRDGLIYNEPREGVPKLNDTRENEYKW